MELLKVEDKRGYYLKNGSWADIKDIERDDLLALIKAAAEHDEVSLAEVSSVDSIGNPIEKVIFQKVYEVLDDLHRNRDVYLADLEAEFDELERQYELK